MNIKNLVLVLVLAATPLVCPAIQKKKTVNQRTLAGRQQPVQPKSSWRGRRGAGKIIKSPVAPGAQALVGAIAFLEAQAAVATELAKAMEKKADDAVSVAVRSSPAEAIANARTVEANAIELRQELERIKQVANSATNYTLGLAKGTVDANTLTSAIKATADAAQNAKDVIDAEVKNKKITKNQAAVMVGMVENVKLLANEAAVAAE